MRINSDFSKRAVIRPGDVDWVPSPAAGVERMMLDRIGDEVARATTIVRYAPNSSFPRHSHDGGEEYIVLDGTFSDESGDYTAGTYVRNPIGSSHSPFTKDGATILVKLHQFDVDDKEQFSIDTKAQRFVPGPSPGLSVLSLHSFGTEHTALVKWEPGSQHGEHRHWGGEEIFVLDGVFSDEHGDYPKGTWLRNPHLSTHKPFSKEGALILVKTGHLPQSNETEQ
ncbi:MAG: cupin domain-containing protein [Parasphingorhabdus sp.]|uniref:cupin domain-containing protein n=1 Tax=Parasphingorhabdus sp. TaxID=2709688 RepID=UPI003296C0A2